MTVPEIRDKGRLDCERRQTRVAYLLFKLFSIIQFSPWSDWYLEMLRRAGCCGSGCWRLGTGGCRRLLLNPPLLLLCPNNTDRNRPNRESIDGRRDVFVFRRRCLSAQFILLFVLPKSGRFLPKVPKTDLGIFLSVVWMTVLLVLAMGMGCSSGKVAVTKAAWVVVVASV